MMNFQDKLQTTAPSIRYEGDIRPEQAQLRQQQAQAMQQMQQQAMMQQPMMQQPQMPQPQPQMPQPQPQMPRPQMPQQQPMMQQPQGRMPAGRMPAMAMGGIAGLNMPGYNDGGTVGSMRDSLKSKGYDWIDDADDDTVRQIFNSEEGTFSIPSRSPRAYGGIMGNPNMADIAGPSDTGNAMDSNMIVVADLMKDLQRTDLTDMERAVAQEKLKAYGSQEQVDSLMGNKNYMEALIEQMQQQGLSKEEMIQEIMGMQSRENKAYGGIMGDDGRRQYGIGSWFQEKIMDPIKKNPIISTAAAAWFIRIWYSRK